MKEIELKAELATHAGKIGKLTRRRLTARPRYDMMSDAIVWTDEIEGLSSEALSVMRFLFRYRTSVSTGEPDNQWADIWSEAKRLFPNWVGFHPSRTQPPAPVLRMFHKCRAEADRDLAEMMKLESTEQSAAPLPSAPAGPSEGAR